MNKNALCLVIGLTLSVLFIIFSTQIYEGTFDNLFHPNNTFEDMMYNNNMYLINSIVTIVFAWGVAGIYYYLIDSVRFGRWYHWLIMLLAVFLLAPSSIYVWGYYEFINSAKTVKFFEGFDMFIFINAFYAVLFFIISSFSMRWWSKNCRHTPIPE